MASADEAKPKTDEAKPKTDEAKPKTVAAKLRCMDLRGETVHTRWGDVAFDKEGLSKIEVPEDEVQMLRDIKPHSWLAEDQVPPKVDKPQRPVAKPPSAPTPAAPPVAPPAKPPASQK